MPRQTISFTDPNSEWLKRVVDIEGEYKSNSEAVNALIRKAREEEQEIAGLRAKLTQAEQSGRSTARPKEIKERVLKRKRQNAKV
ncbi:MAG: type II toxin-antitoxin system ParD family antitoxin [Nitrospira sp.]|nr:type II toxin-antitoxin system ParD family antitoxin [Nitrospira sp.]MCA9467774.1 type II toxin-antitoxin system ParD family antitoxin [Nitrospira sp.]MCA9477324.1 type II toxin-antitoxin system ParD family antitoxin [Nitrospira sp.]MCA9479835.1 type II toxin-antitoxin system ParD family antitoxin [Nitrospira sp.]MCB9776818.1 type II toxin-antitoxin system ParD family antitoxin [Nitrospiraceae bacterium]